MGGTVHLEIAGTKARGKEGLATRINKRGTESKSEASRDFIWRPATQTVPVTTNVTKANKATAAWPVSRLLQGYLVQHTS